MKQFISSLLCLLYFSVSVFSQQTDYRVVFDITSKDTNAHKTVLRQATAIGNANPDAKLEVVLYGQSLDMVLKDKSVVATDIQKISANKNVSFKVCSATLKRYNVNAGQLLPGVVTVPDGIYEIITRQREGWGYIKVAQ